MCIKTKATIEDLYRVPEDGKAELMNGELVLMAATGFLPGRAGIFLLANWRSHQHFQSASCLALKNVAILVMLGGAIILRDATLTHFAKTPLLGF